MCGIAGAVRFDGAPASVSALQAMNAAMAARGPDAEGVIARGRVALGGETWLDAELGLFLPPEQRRVGLVFQDYALFPHLDVRGNVAFGAGGRPVEELLERFRLGALAAAHPRELSGGERPRGGVAGPPAPPTPTVSGS